MDVVIVTLFSGYRNESTLELSLDTYYGPVLNKFLDGESPDKIDHSPNVSVWDLMRVLIPVGDIATIRLFSVLNVQSAQN